jgi:hypothetical protein
VSSVTAGAISHLLIGSCPRLLTVAPDCQSPPNQALHHDRGRILSSRDTTPLQRPLRANWIVSRLCRCEIMEVAKEITELYPDLVEQGGLANALRAALREIGSPLSVSELDKSVRFVVYARVESGPRFSQVYVGAQTRMFSFDFWNRGVYLAHGATPIILKMARSIDKWIASCCTTSELARAFPFVQVQPAAAAYERGEEVKQRWRQYVGSLGERFPELAAFVTAAAAEPKLRQLFPFTSLNRFCFSRCTGVSVHAGHASRGSTGPGSI